MGISTEFYLETCIRLQKVKCLESFFEEFLPAERAYVIIAELLSLEVR